MRTRQPCSCSACIVEHCHITVRKSNEDVLFQGVNSMPAALLLQTQHSAADSFEGTDLQLADGGGDGGREHEVDGGGDGSAGLAVRQRIGGQVGCDQRRGACSVQPDTGACESVHTVFEVVLQTRLLYAQRKCTNLYSS